MPASIRLPEIPDAERTPLVERIEGLAQEIQRQAETIQQLRDEIAVLKGEKAKLKFAPSGMERKTDFEPDPDRTGDTPTEKPAKRAGSAKRRKKPQLTILKDRLLEVALEVGQYVTVDDLGARHQGKDGYVTHIGNDRELIPLNERHRLDQERVRGELWDLYADLKAYRSDPHPEAVADLTTRFDALFTQRTSFESLNRTLKRLHAHKAKRRLFRERPDIPMHANGSEDDIRDYVKGRKIGGGTRSVLRRRCRDTFASLKTTCRKLGIPFPDYLTDRIERLGVIPPLPDIVRERTPAASAVP